MHGDSGCLQALQGLFSLTLPQVALEDDRFIGCLLQPLLLLCREIVPDLPADEYHVRNARVLVEGVVLGGFIVTAGI